MWILKISIDEKNFDILYRDKYLLFYNLAYTNF